MKKTKLRKKWVMILAFGISLAPPVLASSVSPFNANGERVLIGEPDQFKAPQAGEQAQAPVGSTRCLLAEARKEIVEIETILKDKNKDGVPDTKAVLAN